MQRVVKIGNTLRNHWKKSVFLSLAGGYGVTWYQKKLEDNAYMRSLAREAVTYGNQPLHVDSPSYSVTVILNPVASGVKGRTLYEKYCAPLLNLAGLKVSVVRTESDGQAKDIMEIMQDADAVLVAGGDGTLMEVVTGLMRRPDVEVASKVPIGILPVGKTNSMAYQLFPGVDDHVRLMGEATMAVIRQLKKPVGIIEVENKRVGKKIYALNSLELGAWKDTRLMLEKWFFAFGWVQNYLPQALYARGYLTKHKQMVWDCDLDLQFLKQPSTKPVPAPELLKLPAEPSSKSQGFLSWFTGGKGERQEALSVEKRSREEAQWTCLETGQFHGTGLRVKVSDEQLKVSLYPGSVSLGDFVHQGASLLRGGGDILQTREIVTPSLLITPNLKESLDLGLDSESAAEEGKLEIVERRICMDGDDIEMNGPLLITYIKDRISLFCDASLATKEKKTEQRVESASRWSSMTGLGLTRSRPIL